MYDIFPRMLRLIRVTVLACKDEKSKSTIFHHLTETLLRRYPCRRNPIKLLVFEFQLIRYQAMFRDDFLEQQAKFRNIPLPVT